MATSQPVPPAGRTLDVAVHAVEVTKTYGDGPAAVTALDRVSTAFGRRRFTAVMGPSGSGKSTLLRRERVGFVFQAFNLLPTLTAAENLTLPLAIAGRRADPAWVDRVVEAVGLRDRLGHRPGELSGGQQQRLAAARALAARPEVVFADEPTGNLDSRSSAELLGFLRRSVEELGQTIVMVTHDPVAAGHADEVVFLADGRVVDLMAAPTAERVLDRMKALGG